MRIIRSPFKFFEYITNKTKCIRYDECNLYLYTRTPAIDTQNVKEKQKKNRRINFNSVTHWRLCATTNEFIFSYSCWSFSSVYSFYFVRYVHCTYDLSVFVFQRMVRLVRKTIIQFSQR